VKLTQTNNDKNDWSVSELRLLGPEGEIERGKNWRLRSSPNPWDVQLAFDNCPVTRWTAAESSRPGMFIEVELDRPTTLTGVRAEVLPDWAGSARLELEVDGRWKEVASEQILGEAMPLKRTRRLATEDLKRNGITHIAVHPNDFFAADMAKDPQSWGVTLVGEANAMRFYRID
jgi:hypothetical protein